MNVRELTEKEKLVFRNALRNSVKLVEPITPPSNAALDGIKLVNTKPIQKAIPRAIKELEGHLAGNLALQEKKILLGIEDNTHEW